MKGNIQCSGTGERIMSALKPEKLCTPGGQAASSDKMQGRFEMLVCFCLHCLWIVTRAEAGGGIQSSAEGLPDLEKELQALVCHNAQGNAVKPKHRGPSDLQFL